MGKRNSEPVEETMAILPSIWVSLIAVSGNCSFDSRHLSSAGRLLSGALH
jgi:hypothetical protein